jgi:hypothetical protein
MKIGQSLKVGIGLVAITAIFLTIIEVAGPNINEGAILLIGVLIFYLINKIGKYTPLGEMSTFPKAAPFRLSILITSMVFALVIFWQTSLRGPHWMLLVEFAIFFLWINYWEVKWRNEDKQIK